MPRTVDVYYDFRSPFAYYADHRLIGSMAFSSLDIRWDWKPVSIDVLLNLQAGKAAWEPYSDPLIPAKRKYLLSDVRRCAEFYGAVIRAPKPSHPNSALALSVAATLRKAGIEHAKFRANVFAALWQQQRDIADVETIDECLAGANLSRDFLRDLAELDCRRMIADDTQDAFTSGIFGVPTFVLDGEIFFGVDRLDMLAWRVQRT